MPLRDHFHPPLRDRRRWEGFHSAWANTLVRRLNERGLPAGYFAEPQTHLGSLVEIDAATFQEGAAVRTAAGGDGNGVAAAVWAPPQPARTVAVDLPAQDVYEVRVYDEERGARLVAAVELVSPGNKDRAENRRAFAVKCAAYLQQRVAVVVVDVVTGRRGSLHAELLRLLELEPPAAGPEAADLYAVAYRTINVNDAWRLDLWPEALAVGASLPTAPLWLASDLAVPLELEASYEDTCRGLRIT